jgi:predicted O-methyltransferase YrrM
MNNKLFRIIALVRHHFSVRTKFRLHSPFIYRFYSEILKDKKLDPSFEKAEQVRVVLRSDKSLINRTDLGACHGPGINRQSRVRICDLADRSSVTVKKGRLLYRLAKDLNPGIILELGTCLGISTLYLAAAAPNAKIITMEGCPETAGRARLVFEEAGEKNIKLLNGSFDELLPEFFKTMPVIDFLFIDGDHRQQATLNYWAKCTPLLHQGSVAVFDDIHWSAEMESAWKEIIAGPLVKVSIDLYQAGIVFFRSELSKEDFVLRF